MIRLKSKSPLSVLVVGAAGYVGSEVYRHLAADPSLQVGSCDVLKRGNPGGIPFDHPCDVVDIATSDLAAYDVVVWLAGCSNVQDSLMDPTGALEQNVMSLSRLAFALPKTARLIYASSASLYSEVSRPDGTPPDWSEEDHLIKPGYNAYDVSKYCFDYIANSLFENFVSMRFGTVSGFSTNPRNELIFNAMCLSAARQGVVRVANRHAWRSIAFLDHVKRTVQYLVKSHSLPTPKLFLNVASLTDTIGGLGERIARHFNARIEAMPDSTTYSFRLDTRRLDSLGISHKVSLESEIDQFMEKTNAAARH